MAVDKKSFLLYADLIHTVRKMGTENAGELFLHILEYVNDNNPTTDNLIVDLTFEPIKQQFKRDLKKWDSIKEKRSLAGLKSAEKRKQKATKATSVKSVQQKATNPTVNVNGNVTVNDNVTVIDEEEVKEKTSTSSNSLFSVLDLELRYLKNEKVIKAVLENYDNKFKSEEHLKEQLRIFTKELIERNIHTKTESDYASHFRSWHKKKNEPKTNGKKLTGAAAFKQQFQI